MRQVVDKKIYQATEVKSARPKKSSTVQINTSINDVVFCKYPKDSYTPEPEYDKYLPNLKITVRLPETTITNKDGKTIKKDARTQVFYMSPFRDYRMQISGSIDGDGDYASTEVIGFYNLINNLMAGKDRARLAPTNVTYDDRYLGSHSNIVTQLIDSMIRACFNKFITDSPILRNCDAIKVNLGERKTIHYAINGFAILDTFGYFAEIVTVYLITGYFARYKHNIDTMLLDIYTSEVPVYNTEDQFIAKCIKDQMTSIDYLEYLYDIKTDDPDFFNNPEEEHYIINHITASQEVSMDNLEKLCDHLPFD